jgi:hypothetical protein
MSDSKLQNRLIEVTQMINDKNTLTNDMVHAAEVVGGIFKEKYLNPLNSAIKENHGFVEKNPSKEVRLLQAMRAFMPGDKQVSADKMIGMYNQIEAIQRMSGYINNTGTACVHSDGIYEIDENCVRRNSGSNMGGMIMMMLLLLQ